jgi:Damage-control phosphatase ARMT1-like domain
MLSLPVYPLSQSQLIFPSLLRAIFASTIYWPHYDPFFRQKDEAFKSSKNGVLELAERFREYSMTVGEPSYPVQQKLVFVPTGSPNRANLIFNFRKKWRIFVYGGMPRIFHLPCKVTQLFYKRNTIGQMLIKISWWYVADDFEFNFLPCAL